MNKISFEPPKGTRDWYGQDTIIRDYIRNTLRTVFERYGYDRLETPPIERRDVLGFKGGGEIQKEVFRVSDQGGRELALRFDQTVPLARYIASNKGIKFPFKRYVIGEVFRDGPTQPDQGRYRTFTQCDVDVLGVKDMSAEAELFALAQDVFREFGLGGVDVNINNKKLLEGILDYASVPQEARQRTIITLDKLDKIGVGGIERELEGLTLYDQSKGVSDETLQEIFQTYDKGINVAEDLDVKKRIVGELGSRGYDEIMKLFLEHSQTRESLFGGVANYQTKGERLLTPEIAKNILEVVSIQGDNESIFNSLTKFVTSPIGLEGLGEIRQLLDYSKAMGFDFIKLNPVLARGLDYYTGTTIEVYLENRNIVPSAILAGGRFDNMVGDFRGGDEEIPAVGFSFGLERLAMILGAQREFPKTNRQLYLIPIGDTHQQSLKISHDLRNQGLNVDMRLQPEGRIKKAISYASDEGIPYVAFVGEEELKDGRIRIKNLKTGVQDDILVADVKDYISSSK